MRHHLYLLFAFPGRGEAARLPLKNWSCPSCKKSDLPVDRPVGCDSVWGGGSYPQRVELSSAYTPYQQLQPSARLLVCSEHAGSGSTRLYMIQGKTLGSALPLALFPCLPSCSQSVTQFCGELVQGDNWLKTGHGKIIRMI